MKNENKNWPVFLALCLVLGAVLRLSFPGDIEYKEDEKYMFEASQTIGVTQPWPALGMVSGGQVKNPGLSVWTFVALARITHATTPVELARAVQLLNILALALLAFFALKVVPVKERFAWVWATALASANPGDIVFQRKIWAQSTLPLFCVLLWMAWYYRKTRVGAFFWGLIALCIAQIHMSGFFLTAGLFLWTVYREWKAKGGQRAPSGQGPRWGWWLAGSLVGMVPLVPWIQYLFENAGKSAGSFKIFWILMPKYWIYWVADALGLGLTHSMGWPAFLDFLRYPLVGGVATYFMALAHLLMLLAGIRLLYLAKKEGGAKFLRMPSGTQTGELVNALFLAVGGLMTLGCFRIYQHYLIMSFPLEFVWFAWIGSQAPRGGSRHLTLVLIAQLLISAAFLVYIHVNHGIPQADYGTAFQFQTP